MPRVHSPAASPASSTSSEDRNYEGPVIRFIDSIIPPERFFMYLLLVDWDYAATGRSVDTPSTGMVDPLVGHQEGMIATIRYRRWLCRAFQHYLDEWHSNPDFANMDTNVRTALLRAGAKPYLVQTDPHYAGNPFITSDQRIVHWDILFRTANRYNRMIRVFEAEEVLCLGDWAYALICPDGQNFRINSLQQTGLTYMVQHCTEEEFSAILECLTELPGLKRLCQRLQGVIAAIDMMSRCEDENATTICSILGGVDPSLLRRTIARSLERKIFTVLKEFLQYEGAADTLSTQDAPS